MQERWDVVLKVLDGPMAGMGEQVYRGPVVRLGANPGPGGFKLAGYRGLDARHATISAYEGGSATIAPVGTNQVRMAPHPNVNWKDIDPMSGPEYLSEGCALHLGPVGRGATLEFVECRRLGVWQGGDLASEAAPTPAQAGGGQPGSPPSGAPPEAFDARSTRTIRASSVPVWFVGCLVLMAGAFSTIILAVVFIEPPEIERLGPVEEGEDFYDFAQVEEVDKRLLKGIDQPFNDFVMTPNIEVSGRAALNDPDNWDQSFKDMVAASMQTHLKSWSVFKRLDVIREDYAEVLEVMRAEGLPDVFAGIPYLESRYHLDLQSAACARGPWQFMPEVAYRIDRDSNIGFQVKSCRFKDADVTWEPTDPTPVKGVMKNAVYVDDNPDLKMFDPRKCRIDACAVDDRIDLERSTRAAAFALGEAWRDPDLRESGALVQMTIASHNAGYDDSRFGRRKRFNVRPAYFRWKEGKDRDEWPRFYGANITTETPHTRNPNGSVLWPETQHYVYTIVAEHLLAVCYYGQSYHDEIRAFREYRQYTRGDGFCRKLEIPSADEVKKHN